MNRYELPKHLEIGPNQNRRRQEEKGKLVVSFGGSSLVGRTYDPLGLSALWLLVGTVASLGESFTFEVKVGMRSDGFYGGFADGRFCLFDLGRDWLETFTHIAINPIGSKEIDLRDDSHMIGFRVPAAAMISFEEMVAVGNAVLLSTGGYVRTRAYQFNTNWENSTYHEPAERSDKSTSQ